MQPNVFNPTFKSSFQTFFTRKLLEASDLEFQESIDDLCRKQSNINGKRVNALFYRDEVFQHSLQGKDGRIAAPDASLIKQLDEAISLRKGFTPTERATILNHLKNVLNCCNTPNDLLVLLPEQTHKLFIDKIEKHLESYEETITKEEFYSKYPQAKDDEQVIKQRIMLNLLII